MLNLRGSIDAAPRRRPHRRRYFQCEVGATGFAVNLPQLQKQSINVARVEHAEQRHFFDSLKSRPHEQRVVNVRFTPKSGHALG